MDALVRLFGKQGERALHHANLERKDDGYFGPSSVSWKVWGHPHIAIAGIRGSLVAVLDPAGAAGVAQHGVYRRDPLGRVRRSNAFFLTAVFGDTAMAEQAGTWLFRRHATVNGTVPTTGQAYRANTPETLLFVYVTGWHGTLESYRRFGGRSLSEKEEREFYAESVITAELLGIPADLVPATPEAVRDYLGDARASIMAMTDDAQELFDFFLKPPLEPAWPMMAVNPFIRIAARAAVSTLPTEILELTGLAPTPVRNAVYGPLVKASTTALTLPLLHDFLAIAGGEAWGVQQNGLRHSSGTGRVPMVRSRAAELQEMGRRSRRKAAERAATLEYDGSATGSKPIEGLMPAWTPDVVQAP